MAKSQVRTELGILPRGLEAPPEGPELALKPTGRHLPCPCIHPWVDPCGVLRLGVKHGGRKKPFIFRQPDPVHKRLEEYSGNITVLGKGLKRSAGYYAVAALAAT